MDFDFYRNFIVVAETGNISAAAKRLAIVQPALSAQIKTLEKYYGIQLFKMNRGKRHIELTEAGEAFLQQVRTLCSTEDNINLTMQAFGQQAAGTLRFSVSHVRSNYFIQNYLIPFALQQPKITYQFHDATVEQQQEHLTKGSSDFAFANAPLPVAHDFATVTGRREYFFALYNKDFPVPWQQEQPLTPPQLEGLPLCCNYGSYPLLRSVCKGYGFRPQISFIGTTASNALTFAASGLGIAVIAALPEDPVPSTMTRLQVADAKLAFAQTLYWSPKNKMTPAAELFLKFFQERKTNA